VIDPETGAVSFEAPACRIQARLTRSIFAASALGAAASVAVANEPWCSWRLQGQYVSTLTFLVTLYFHGERLWMTELYATFPDETASWDSWSLEQEMTRKSQHDGWLDKALGGRRDFDWGTVSSGYDEKGGFSAIWIKYARNSD
jgi:hypothetical protein